MVKDIDVNDEFTIEIFEYLDDLRESGATNMYGASSYLSEAYGFDTHVAQAFLAKWMDTFGDRHPKLK